MSKYDTKKLADILISSWQGKAHMSALYGVAGASYGNVKKHVKDVIDIVLGV